MRVRRSGSAAAGASGSVNSDFGSSCNTPSLGAGGGAGDWSVLRLHGSPGRAVLRWDADEAAAPGYQVRRLCFAPALANAEMHLAPAGASGRGCLGGDRGVEGGMGSSVCGSRCPRAFWTHSPQRACVA